MAAMNGDDKALAMTHARVEPRRPPAVRWTPLGLLDALVRSAANYWVAMACDVIMGLLFLALGFSRASGPAIGSVAAALAGLFGWGFLEYALHRWLLHAWPSPARDGHARHHAHPGALVSTPAFVIPAAAFAVWWLLHLVFPAGLAAFVVFGMYVGFDYYSVLHHLQHHRGADLARVAYLRRLEHLHHLHHGRPTVNFGVSTTLWDRIFGTFQPSNARRPAMSRRDRHGRDSR
jgi:4-hydroxysphinganine ceramide fatty acyl 2-hydroxylase